MTRLKNMNCEKTKKTNWGKTIIFSSNFDKTQKSYCDKTQKSNCEKNQKISNYDSSLSDSSRSDSSNSAIFFSKNNLTSQQPMTCSHVSFL